MYSNILAESLIRQRENEMREFIEQQQLIKQARIARMAKKQENDVLSRVRRMLTFIIQRNRPAVISEDCA